MNTNKLFRNLFILAICFAFFLYVAFRAWNLSLTHDEGLSFTILKGDPMWVYTPNNHILNTQLMKISSSLFGESELALRLPNVLAFALYLSCCFFFLKKQENLLLIVSGIAFLLCNHYMIDFFSLARGYGLGMGLIMASLYFLLRENMRDHTFYSITRDFFLSLFFASLTLLANLSTLYFLLSVLGIFAGQYLWLALRDANLSWKNHLLFVSIILVAAIPLYFAMDRLLWLSSSQQFYFGSDSIEGTLSDLSLKSFNDKSWPWIFPLLKYVLFLSLTAGMLIVILQKKWSESFFRMILLLALVFSGLIAGHYFFKVNYPPDRTITFMIPVLMLFFYLFTLELTTLFRPAPRIWVSALVFVTAGIPLLFSFTTNMNLKYAYEWRFDGRTKDAMLEIGKLTPKNTGSGEKLIVSNNWLFHPAMNYYIGRENLNFHPATRDSIHPNAAFIYEFKGEHSLPDYVEIADFPDINTVLYRKR